MNRSFSFAGLILILASLPGTGNLGARQAPSRQVFKIAIDPTGHAIGTVTQAVDGFDEAWNPSISPDGRQVAHWFRSGNRAGIAVRDIITGATRRLTDEVAAARPHSAMDLSKPLPLKVMALVLANEPLAWQSSTMLVYAERQNTDNVTRLRVLNTTTGVPRALPYGDINSTTWQLLPQRDELIYVADSSRGDGAIRIRSLSDGSERTLDTGPDAVIGFVVSSDQRRLAYVRLGLRFSSLLELDRPDVDQSSLIAAFAKGAEIRIIGADGQGDRLLAAFPRASFSSLAVGALAWSPDDRFLLLRGAGGRFRITSTDTGGQGWNLGGLTGDAVSNWGHARWTADGSIWMTRMTGMTAAVLFMKLRGE